MTWIWRTNLAASVLAAALAGGAARANETIVYSYDALGRLTAAAHSGTVNNGLTGSLCYDRAGNRVTTRSNAAGGLASCTAPTPQPPSLPPVANANALTAPKCVQRSVNVIANDSDPEGYLPLTLTAVNQGWAWVESGTNVGMTTPDTNGVYTITYTVANALGVTANGTLTLTVSGAQQCV